MRKEAPTKRVVILSKKKSHPLGLLFSSPREEEVAYVWRLKGHFRKRKVLLKWGRHGAHGKINSSPPLTCATPRGGQGIAKVG